MHISDSAVTPSLEVSARLVAAIAACHRIRVVLATMTPGPQVNGHPRDQSFQCASTRFAGGHPKASGDEYAVSRD